MMIKMLMYLNHEVLRKEKSLKGLEKVVDFNHEVYRKKLLGVLCA